MKEQNVNEEVIKILKEAPDARKALRENYNNLLNVADYCYNNYVQVIQQLHTDTTTATTTM